jgi:excinuclease UvrABC nuclease subunit
VINYIKKYERFFVGCVEIRDNKISEVKNYEIENTFENTEEEILEKFILLKEYNTKNIKKLNFLLPIELPNKESLEESIAQMNSLKQVKIEIPKL